MSAVPIIHSSSEGGSVPQLLHLTCLSEILKCKLLDLLAMHKWFGSNVWAYFLGICKHFKHTPESLTILQLPIGSIPLGTWMPKLGDFNKQPLAMLRPNAPLSAALSLLIQGDVVVFMFDENCFHIDYCISYIYYPFAAEVSSIPIVDNNDSLLDICSIR